MSDQSSQAEPISVKASATPIITQEAAKVLIGAGLTYFLATHFSSETVLGAMLPAVPVASIVMINGWQRLRTWVVLKKLANAVTDDIAIIGNGKPKK